MSVLRADYRGEARTRVELVTATELVVHAWGGRKPVVQIGSVYRLLSLGNCTGIKERAGLCGKHMKPQMFVNIYFKILDWVIHI